ncbi:hypothetical protein GCM10009826_35070 [Humibacillus xanthopallidus]
MAGGIPARDGDGDGNIDRNGNGDRNGDGRPPVREAARRQAFEQRAQPARPCMISRIS